MAIIPAVWRDGVKGLDWDRPPPNFPLDRWRNIIDECDKLLDNPVIDAIIRYRWNTLDVFGCNKIAPLSRTDQMGLVFLIGGRRIIGANENSCAIITNNDVTLTYYRKPKSEAVAIWEL